MFSAIASLFSAVVQAIVAVVNFFVDLVKEHPRATIALVVTCLVVFVTFKITHSYTEKRVWEVANVKIDKLKTALDKANKETEERNLKIASLVADSTTFAEDMAKRLETTNAALKQTVSKYEARLAAEKAKAKEGGKIGYVQVPGEVGPPIEVQLQGREVIGTRFSDTFLTTVNELIDIANQPINLKTSLTLSIPGA